jgi:hypothetical protein
VQLHFLVQPVVCPAGRVSLSLLLIRSVRIAKQRTLCCMCLCRVATIEWRCASD